MDTTGSAPWYRLVGTLVLESGEPPGCWAAPCKSQASLPIRARPQRKASGQSSVQRQFCKRDVASNLHSIYVCPRML